MGTFFDKITSPYTSPPELPAPEDDIHENEMPAPKRAPVRKPRTLTPIKEPKIKKEPKPIEEEPIMPSPKETHLAIDAGDTQREEATEEREEDGELTVDIYDRGDSIVVQSTVAGVKPEDLDISITSDSITIRGKRRQAEEIRDEDYYYKELFWGAFSRSIILPEEIEEGEAEANLKHGLLSIRLPKKKRNTVQKLKVKVT